MAYRFVLLLATVGMASASGVGYMAAPAIAAAPLGLPATKVVTGDARAMGFGWGGSALGLGWGGNALGLGWGSGAIGMAAPAAIGFAAPAPMAWGGRAIGLAAAPVAVAAPAAFAVAAPLAVPAAIQSRHAVATYDVPTTGMAQPVTVDVPANVMDMNFVFRSASSNINVAAKHEGAKGSLKETFSQDEPHVLKHTVTKPIIQEVSEIVSPYRKITQTIEPVREEVNTLVAKGVGHHLATPVAAAVAAPTAVVASPASFAIGTQDARFLAAPAAIGTFGMTGLAGRGIGFAAAPACVGLGCGGAIGYAAAPACAGPGCGGAFLAKGYGIGQPALYKAGNAFSAAPLALSQKMMKAW